MNPTEGNCCGCEEVVESDPAEPVGADNGPRSSWRHEGTNDSGRSGTGAPYLSHVD